MLDGPGECHREVQVRSDDLPGQSHLTLFGYQSGVHRAPRAAHPGSQRPGKALCDVLLELLGRVDPPSPTHDDLRVLDARALGFLQDSFDALRLDFGGVNACGDVHDFPLASFVPFEGLHGPAPDGGQLRPTVFQSVGGQRVASGNRFLCDQVPGLRVYGQAHAVHHEPCLQAESQPGGQVPARDGLPQEQDRRCGRLRAEPFQDRSEGCPFKELCGRVLNNVDPVGAAGDCVPRTVVRLPVDQDGRAFLAPRVREPSADAEQFQGDRGKLAFADLTVDEYPLVIRHRKPLSR